MKVKIKDIEVDEDIYPRKDVTTKTIDSYQESLQAGTKFPSIIIQKIISDGQEKTIIMDGVHRWKAHKGEKLDEIDAGYWKDEVLDKKGNLKDLRIASIKLNLKHGDRLTNIDKELMCRTMAESDPKITIKYEEFAEIFNVTPRSIGNWIGHIRAKQKGSRDNLIYKLHLLGWTQQKIADVVGIEQPQVNEILSIFEKFQKSIKDEFDSGKFIEQIAEYNGLDLQTTWAIILQDKSDIERLGILSKQVDGLNCNPRPYDVWNFAGSHKLMGHKYAGQIPGQIILQLLYFYTKQNDLIIDPMAGSGTTIDACLLMNRNCMAFDIEPSRNEICLSDAIKAIKNIKKKANLIFLDPPYFKKKEKEYGENSISILSKGEYLSYFGKMADICKEKITPDGKVALLMSDYTEDDASDSIFIHHYIDLFEDKGFIVERILLVPLSPEVIHADFINKYRVSRKLCRLARYLVIFCAT